MNRALQVEYEILNLCKRYTHAQPYGTARPDLANFIRQTVPSPGNADTEVVDALKRLHEGIVKLMNPRRFYPEARPDFLSFSRHKSPSSSQ